MRFDVHVMEICGDLRHTFPSHRMEAHILKMQLFNQGGGSQKKTPWAGVLENSIASATRTHIEDYPSLGEQFVYAIFTWSVARGSI